MAAKLPQLWLKFTATNPVISRNFLVWEILRKGTVSVARNYAETVLFHKISTPEIRRNYGIFRSDCLMANQTFQCMLTKYIRLILNYLQKGKRRLLNNHNGLPRKNKEFNGLWDGF